MWRCTCASKHCLASAYTDLLPANPVLKTDHNHCPEPVKLEVDRCRAEMRIRAVASNDPPARIYADNITALTDAAKAILPSVDTCNRTIARNRTHKYPAEPASLANLHIVPPWTHTLGQQQEEFPFFDNGPQNHCLRKENNLRRLAAADKWYMDGNFAMAPPKFLQLYVMHVSLGQVTIPLVYAFLQNKTEATCHELVTAILNRCATYGVRPDTDFVTVDFELAIPRSLAAVLGSGNTYRSSSGFSTWHRAHGGKFKRWELLRHIVQTTTFAISVACLMALRFCHQLTSLLAWHTCVPLHQLWLHHWSTTSTRRTSMATTDKVGHSWEVSGWCESLPCILCRRGMCTMQL